MILSRTRSVGRYFFAIDAESEWALFRHVGDNVARLHDYTSSPALHGGLHATNILAVEFRGQQITCLANGIQLGVVNDQDTELEVIS